MLKIMVAADESAHGAVDSGSQSADGRADAESLLSGEWIAVVGGVGAVVDGRQDVGTLGDDVDRAKKATRPVLDGGLQMLGLGVDVFEGADDVGTAGSSRGGSQSHKGGTNECRDTHGDNVRDAASEGFLAGDGKEKECGREEIKTGAGEKKGRIVVLKRRGQERRSVKDEEGAIATKIAQVFLTSFIEDMVLPYYP